MLMILKFVGWIFVPYIMIFVQWNKMGKTGRIIGSSWVALLLITAILPKDKATEAPMVSAAVPVNTVTKADDDAKAKAEADAKTKKEEAAKAKADADAKAKKAEAEAKSPHLGDTATAGALTVTLDKKVKAAQTIGNEFLNEKAQGTYWVFSVSVKNGDKAARMIDTSMFKLISNDGTKYDPDSKASMYANENGKFFLQNINPGIQSNGFIVFDMPTDVIDKIADFKLKVDSGIGFKAGTSVDFLLNPNL